MTETMQYEEAEFWIIQRLSNLQLDNGRSVGLVQGESTRSSAYTSGGTRPRPYTEPAATREIDAEEGRLMARARAEGWFWGRDDLGCLRNVIHSTRAGGHEHDVYLAGRDPSTLMVIRNTIKDSYGFAHRSPAQYLKRLEDYNRAFPGIQTRVIGVSTNERGNGVIWTVQPFVDGREFGSDAELRRAMEGLGWERSADISYTHMETGVVIHDAHTGNILYKGNELFPVDVIVEYPLAE